MFLDWVYNNDPWQVIAAFVVTAVAVASLGLWLSYAFTDRKVRDAHGELVNFTVSNMAVLYAVLLAFIAVATWESYAKANEFAQVEANLAGNLYRDTTGMPAPVAKAIKAEVRAYLNVVITQEWPVQRAGRVTTAGWSNLGRTHRLIASIKPTSQAEGTLMQEMLRGMNELYSARTSRLDAVQGHIPFLVWFVILALGALTIGYTCLAKADGFFIHWLMLTGLTVALTLVVALIVELDFPFRGVISVDPHPYENVLHELTLTGD